MRTHLASLVEEFRRHDAETAIVLHRGNRRYRTSYGALAVLAGRFAAELDRSGVSAGERVVLWGENSAEWVAAFFGCVLRGVLAVPLDAAGSPNFAGRVIADVSPKLIVGDPFLLRRLDSAVPRVAFSDLEELLPKQPNFDVSPAVSAETPFQIIFTSGTTSDPKGIVHTHRNVLASLRPIEEEIAKYRRYEFFVHPLRFLQTLPLSHVFGQFMGLWIPSLLVAEVYFDAQMEPARMIDSIRTERISVLVAVPRLLELLRTHMLGRFAGLAEEVVDSQGISAWKLWWRFRKVHRAFGLKFWALICGGASLPSELERFWNTLGFAVIQGYGMTETTALVTLNHPFRIGRGSIGKVLPGREVLLRDGEILVRGEMLSSATWQGGRLKPREEEWLATGDLAERDEAGELHFVGRQGDVVVTASGMNIHPADVEDALAHQPGVRGCVVVGCKVLGAEEPVAVVMFSGSEDELNAAIGRANKQLAAYQQIRRFLRWPELNFPYTSTGKLLRREVSRWACDSLSGRQQIGSKAGDSGKDVLLAAIGEITSETSLSGDDKQRLSEDMHLDSLGRVQLQSVLEQRFGIELSDDAMAEVGTVGQLRALVGTALGSSTTVSASEEVLREVEGKRSEPQEGAGAARNRPEESGSSVALESTYPHWPWSLPIRLVRMLFLELIARPLIWVLANPRVVRDSAKLQGGPFLLIANHVTAYDGALILYALPAKQRRRVAIAMSGEMLLDMRKGRNQGSWLQNILAPASYWLLTALFNTFPLPRLRGFRRSFAHAGEALDRGYSVLIFPEGHRSEDGKLQTFRPGIGLLAHDSRVPVLPVGLIGLGEMRAGNRWFRSGRLTVHVGEAVLVDDAMEPAELTRMLEEVIRRLASVSGSVA